MSFLSIASLFTHFRFDMEMHFRVSEKVYLFIYVSASQCSPNFEETMAAFALKESTFFTVINLFESHQTHTGPVIKNLRCAAKLCSNSQNFKL